MRREQLEHLIRAAATIADDDEIVVIGSQAILGAFPDAPAELVRRETLLERLTATEVVPAVRELAMRRIAASRGD